MRYRSVTSLTTEDFERKLNEMAQAGYLLNRWQFCAGQFIGIFERPYGEDELSTTLLKSLQEVRRCGDSDTTRSTIKAWIAPLVKNGSK